LKNTVNTFIARLVQVVRAKTAGSHVALRGNFSSPVSATDLVKSSKDSTSLVLCTRKTFFAWGMLICCEWHHK